jgi:hypothetical protein
MVAAVPSDSADRGESKIHHRDTEKEGRSGPQMNADKKG